MATMSDVEIVGMQAVFQLIDQQIADIEAKADEAVQAAGIECQAESKKLAPVDTGRLRSSIQYNPGHLECTVGTNVEYAIFQELGTRHVPPHPFLLPGFELAKAHLLDELNNL
jgi:HK97 gp10 family phage protein